MDDKQNKVKFSLKELLRLIRRTHPKYLLFIIGLICLIISSSIQVYVPKIASSLVNQFQKGVDKELLIRVVGLFLVSALFSGIGGTVLGIFGERIIRNLRIELWHQLILLRIPYFDSIKSGELTSRVTNDTSQIKQLVSSTFPHTIASVITVVGTVYMMFLMDWKMSLLMVITVPSVLLIFIPIIRFGIKISHARQDAMSRFNGIITETLNEIRLVKTSNAEKQAQESADKETGNLYRLGRKEAIFDAAMQPIMTLAMMSMMFGLLAYGMARIAKGEMSIGILMSFLMYLFNLMGAMPMIGTLFSELAKAAGSTSRVVELLKTEDEDYISGKIIDIKGLSLKAEHIHFYYQDDPSQLILKDISFEVKPNEVIAFAGPSGGGKSTIFSLIERFYQPVNGVIKLGDYNIEDINLSYYRSQIGFVSQDSAIMAGTVRDNLTYGLEGYYSDKQLWDVLEMAYAKTFVEEMPNQLETEVGERGSKISGGQKQRLAIARAFLRNPKILMLDEATANLDSESEAMVQKALEKLMKGRTVLVIAHRLSTIVDSDRIYFIEKGMITGSGNHLELVKSHKTYAKYVVEQFKSDTFKEREAI